jgi:hypothetical protein
VTVIDRSSPGLMGRRPRPGDRLLFVRSGLLDPLVRRARREAVGVSGRDCRALSLTLLPPVLLASEYRHRPGGTLTVQSDLELPVWHSG